MQIIVNIAQGTAPCTPFSIFLSNVTVKYIYKQLRWFPQKVFYTKKSGKYHQDIWGRITNAKEGKWGGSHDVFQDYLWGCKYTMKSMLFTISFISYTIKNDHGDFSAVYDNFNFFPILSWLTRLALHLSLTSDFLLFCWIDRCWFVQMKAQLGNAKLYSARKKFPKI